MNQTSPFSGGLLLGGVLWAFSCLVTWHFYESACQRENNVSDCVLSEDFMVPAPAEVKQ